MTVKMRNVIPALKDKIIRAPVTLNVVPTGSAAVLFMDPWYDYQVVGMAALVTVVTQAVACPFTLGYGSYTDINGVIQPAVATQFLSAANCLDKNGQSFSTQILPVGTFNFFTVQADPAGQGLNILRAGAPLTITVPVAANTGQIMLVVGLRPKDKDRGDSSKRPFGASDAAYASYFK